MLSLAFDFSSEHGPPDVHVLSPSMLICQPPITKMEVSITCCHPYPARRWSNPRFLPSESDLPEAITSETGITVGDLCDAYQAMLDKHSLCPHAEPIDHTAVGRVKVDPQFRGTIYLRDDDPYCAQQWKNRRLMKLESDSHTVFYERMQAYFRAKQDGELRTFLPLQLGMLLVFSIALGAGLQIPTLEQYEGLVGL